MTMTMIGSRAAALQHRILRGAVRRWTDYDLIAAPAEAEAFLADLQANCNVTRAEQQWNGTVLAIDVGERTQENIRSGKFRHFDIELTSIPTANHIHELPEGQAFDHVERISFASGYAVELPVRVPTLQWLAMIKRSHMHRPSPKWHKQINAYSMMRMLLQKDEDGRVFTKEQRDVLRARIRETNSRTKQHEPRLVGMTKEKFFAGEDVLFRQPLPPLWDHDLIHIYLSKATGYDAPAYTKMTPNEVECNREMWDALPTEDKIRCVIEEAAVIAAERSLAPFHFLKQERLFPEPTQDQSFYWGLFRLCTTLTSGWFRSWAIDHYFEVVTTYRKQYQYWWQQLLDAPPPFWKDPEYCEAWIRVVREVRKKRPDGKEIVLYPAYKETR